LVLGSQDVMHRTAPSQSKTGKRIALTLRYVDPDARYNGCLEQGLPAFYYGVYETSKLWHRLYHEKRGARIIEQ